MSFSSFFICTTISSAFTQRSSEKMLEGKRGRREGKRVGGKRERRRGRRRGEKKRQKKRQKKREKRNKKRGTRKGRRRGEKREKGEGREFTDIKANACVHESERAVLVRRGIEG